MTMLAARRRMYRNDSGGSVSTCFGLYIPMNTGFRMDRLRIAVLALLLAGAVSGAVAAKTGWELDGLRGKVRTRTVETYRVDVTAGTPVTNLSSRTVDSYGAGGDLVSSRRCSVDGTLQYELRVRPGTDARQSISDLFDGNGALFNTFVDTKDGAGNVVAQALLDREGKLFARTVFSWLPDGKKGGQIQYDAAGAPVTGVPAREVHSYDARGWLAETASFHADGTVGVRIVYSRDAEGNLTGTETRDALGKPVSRLRHALVFDSCRNETVRTTWELAPADGRVERFPSEIVKTVYAYFP